MYFNAPVSEHPPFAVRVRDSSLDLNPMAVYRVRLVNPDLKLDQVIEVPDDEYILDIAEAAGLRLPKGCCQGQCSACVAQLLSGTLDQNEQQFLQAAEIDAGYVVTCVSYPRSDCTLLTHQESVLYQGALYYTHPSPEP